MNPTSHLTPKQIARSLYNAWSNMIAVCYNTDRPKYKFYGAKGITVSQEWRDSFEQFTDDMGPKPSPRHVLDRKDKTQGFSKENCRWSLKRDQLRNYSRNVRLPLETIRDAEGNEYPAVDRDGKPITAVEASEITGIHPSTLTARLRHFHYTPEEAISIPTALTVTYHGVTRTYAEWSEIVGVSAQCLYGRIVKSGWPLELAMTTPAQPRDRVFTCRGKSLTLREWSEELGVSWHALYHRIFIRGASPESALTGPRVEYFEYAGEKRTLPEWARCFSIGEDTLRRRIKLKGWSLAQALETPVNHKFRRKGRQLNIED